MKSSAPVSAPGGDPVARQLSLLLAIVAIAVCWPLIAAQIPPASRFAFADLVAEHWAHRDALEPWLGRRWAWLALHDYHFWFAAAVLPGIFAIALVQAFDQRSAKPLLLAPLGWGGGGALGWLVYTDFRALSWPLAVMMPATFAFLGGAIGARIGSLGRRARHLRGTRLRPAWSGAIGRRWARLTGGVALAGVPLARADETMHVAVIGATGSGKSSALRALMADALRRGDRQLVADPRAGR